MNICWFFENWAIFMSPQFQIEIIFSVIANESEEFPFHHQSQNIPQSIVSFEYKHTDKIVANIYWMFNLCQLPCWHNNLWSGNFYQFLSVLTQKGRLGYSTSFSEEMKEAGSEPISDSKAHVLSTTSFFKTWQDTGHERQGT